MLDPKMAEAALNLGILLLNEEPAAAVRPLERAVELLPTESRPSAVLKSFGRRRRMKVLDERTRGEHSPSMGNLILGCRFEWFGRVCGTSGG